ncbi:unnamed protein product [Closterium sp. Naga37s-1]|nr:unnamed protein product [Closterium sp. Naga37s-1]
MCRTASAQSTEQRLLVEEQESAALQAQEEAEAWAAEEAREHMRSARDAVAHMHSAVSATLAAAAAAAADARAGAGGAGDKAGAGNAEGGGDGGVKHENEPPVGSHVHGRGLLGSSCSSQQHHKPPPAPHTPQHHSPPTPATKSPSALFPSPVPLATRKPAATTAATAPPSLPPPSPPPPPPPPPGPWYGLFSAGKALSTILVPMGARNVKVSGNSVNITSDSGNSSATITKGSRWQSLSKYSSGVFQARMTCPANDTTGLLFSFFVRSPSLPSLAPLLPCRPRFSHVSLSLPLLILPPPYHPFPHPSPSLSSTNPPQPFTIFNRSLLPRASSAAPPDSRYPCRLSPCISPSPFPRFPQLSTMAGEGNHSGVSFDFPGANKTQLYATHHINGRAYPITVPLNFSCDAQPHLYTIYWDAKYTAWYVDQVLVRLLQFRPKRSYPTQPMYLYGTLRPAAATNMAKRAGVAKGNYTNLAQWTGITVIGPLMAQVGPAPPKKPPAAVQWPRTNGSIMAPLMVDYCDDHCLSCANSTDGSATIRYDNRCGSRFRSSLPYYFAFISGDVRCAPGLTSGIVTSFYVRALLTHPLP